MIKPMIFSGIFDRFCGLFKSKSSFVAISEHKETLDIDVSIRADGSSNTKVSLTRSVGMSGAWNSDGSLIQRAPEILENFAPSALKSIETQNAYDQTKISHEQNKQLSQQISLDKKS